MPSAFSNLTGTAPQTNILLIEEYDALAVAIGSALKKFASEHTTHLATSLAEAEKLAKKLEPALFVIDFDPAYSGLTAFLQKMREAHPEARVLVIAPGFSPEIAAERRSFGALQFIEKPFEVANFGAAVQALLGPWKESESAHSRGTLQSLNLADIVLLQCVGGRSALIEVKENDGDYGEIHVVEGQLYHAQTGQRSGTEALEEMLAWSAPEICEREKPSSSNRSIHGPWATVFLKSFQQVKPRQLPAFSPEEEPVRARQKTGKKIVVIDDTEMLLIFVEDALAIADPELQITTALNGTNGIKEVEQVMPNLILLDYSLPDFNGDEVCRRLLQNERTANIPVLMMSGHVAEMSQTAVEFENVVATIAKPFLSEALIALVHEMLNAKGKPVRKIQAPAKAAKASLPPIERTPRRTNGEFVAAKSAVAVAPPPIQPPPLPVSRAAFISAPAMAQGGNDIVLGLFLEVISMQLTPLLRMGTIRARPSSLTVSLHVVSPALRASLPETGFQLGRAELNGGGRIGNIRVIPTLEPFRPLQTRNAFEIGGVAVVPASSRERVQLTPAPNAPMTMQLLAHLELSGVELSSSFQLSQLILKTRANTVRVTLSAQATGEQSGATCEVTGIQLDASGRISELILNPIS